MLQAGGRNLNEEAMTKMATIPGARDHQDTLTFL
jgi:hypothetical protein